MRPLHGTALLGGAFDPPHAAHIQMAERALALGCERVVFVPSANPPHKRCTADFFDRVAMLEAAIAGRADMSVDTIEGGDGAVHYSYLMLPRLVDKYGDCVFVIGGDSLIDLGKWREPDKVVAEVPLLAFPRKDRDESFASALEFWRGRGARIYADDFMPDGVSSTAARYLASMRDYSALSPEVAEYVRRRGLYDWYTPLADKLKGAVLPKTYEHIKRTVVCALGLDFECGLGLDGDKVFLAAMLHDCAKKICREQHDVSHVPADCVGSEVEHQFMGAYLARTEYGVTDAEVIGAIACHCTGKPGMNTLDKLIFCADMLEPARDFDGVEELRRTIRRDFEKGFRACLIRSYDYLVEKGADIYPLTLRAAEYYRND